jgi:hypothetical protein
MIDVYHTDLTTDELTELLNLFDGVIGLAPGDGIALIPSDSDGLVFAAIRPEEG